MTYLPINAMTVVARIAAELFVAALWFTKSILLEFICYVSVFHRWSNRSYDGCCQDSRRTICSRQSGESAHRGTLCRSHDPEAADTERQGQDSDRAFRFVMLKTLESLIWKLIHTFAWSHGIVRVKCKMQNFYIAETQSLCKIKSNSVGM